MGFFDRLGDVWTDWDFRWGKSGEALGQSWEATKEAWKLNNAVTGNLILTAFGQGDANTDAFWASKSLLDRSFDQVGNMGSAVGGVFGALGEQPGFRQVFGTADFLQRELVGRPIATANLVRADAVNERNLGMAFEGDTWREAYNTTTYVTPGQAFAFATGSNVEQFWEMMGVKPDAELRKRFLEDHPTLGIILQDPKAYDPRDRDNARRVYYDNNLMKGLSGTLDAGIVIVGDPTVVFAKAAGLAKLRHVSKPMDAAAIQTGKFDKHIDSTSYRKAKDFVQRADSSETVRRRMFNNHYDGDLVSALLFDAAKSQQRYERADGVVDLYDTTYRALYGDVYAWQTLAQEAPRIAVAVGNERASYTIANAAQNYGLGDRGINAKVEALMETERRAWVDATVNGYGMWGKIRTAPLAGQTPPKLTATSAWRTGVYSFVRNKAPVTLGHWARRGNYFLPSQRSPRMLDLNNSNSTGDFRAHLQLTRLSQKEIDRWVGAYSRATSSETRFNVHMAAENYVHRKVARAYGYTDAELDEQIALANKLRRGNRQFLGVNRRFASEDVQKVYEEKLKTNRLRSARQLAEEKKKIDDAVERGDFPNSYFTLPDEHGNLALVPEDSNLRLDKPFAVTQHGEVVPMVDWNVLENALWWNAGFGRGKPAGMSDGSTWAARVGRKVYSSKEYMRAGLEAVMSTWKVAAILRPGYVPRTLSDESFRSAAVLGAFPYFATMGRGSKNTIHNMSSRVGLLGEIAGRRKARAHAGGERIEADAQVVETDVRPTLAQRPGGPSGPVDPLSPVEVANIRQAVVAGDSLDAAVPRVLTATEWAVLQEGIAQGLSAKRLRLKLAEVEAHNVVPDSSPTYDRMLADGVIGVDDYLSQIELQGNAGALEGQLFELYDSYRSGVLPYSVFKRQAVDHAMLINERGAYVSPAWQRELIETIIDVHKTKKLGKPGEGLLIDPFTGGVPDLTPSQLEHVGILSRHEIQTRPDGRFHVDDLYDFIADNIDELLKPNNLLSAFVLPSGRISLAVSRNMNPVLGRVKETSGLRVKLPWSKREGDLLRDSGGEEVTLRTAVGEYTFQAAFGGGEGDRLRKQVRSRGPENAHVDAVTDIQFARFVEQSQRYSDVDPEDWESYKASWERDVRLQIGKDPVAQQFLQNKSYNDVLQWLFNTSEGRAYQFRMGHFRSQFAERIAGLQAMVDTYVPFNEQRPGESLTLRQRVLDGTATIEDLEAVIPRSKMPKVHGLSTEYATGRGPIMDKIKTGTDRTFEVLSDLPNDKLVRFPFAAERYSDHIKTVAEARGVFAAATNRTFSQADIKEIERVARSRTLRDVQRYLFNANATWDLAKALRLYIPFGSSLADSALKWGVALRENPGVLIHIWKVWSAPERAGLVTDEDGNQLEVEEGREVWYSVNPKTGERTRLEEHQPEDRFITFRLPSWLSERYYGGEVKPQVRINKRIFQTFLDLPTAGPIIAVPANKFALDNPEFSENRFVKKWILPFGPTANTSQTVFPSNVQNVRRVLFPNFAEADRQRTEAQAISIFAAEMTSYTLQERPNPPTFEEARDKAAAMRGLRFWAAFGAGISPQIQSPYQPYVDYYRQLRVQEADLRRKAGEEGKDQAEVPAADQLFYEEMGPEFFALTARVTRNALGIPATIRTNKAYQKYQDLINKHPDIASLIIGQEGGGEFSRAVYEAQKLQELRPGAGEKQRGRLSQEEAWEDVQRRKGWLEYGKYQDLVLNDLAMLGLNSVEDAGAERIKDAREKFIAEREFVESPWGETVLNPWFEDFRTIDTARMIGRLHSFRDIIQDPRLQGRDDIRGLIEYLHLRDRFTKFMDRQGYASLASDEAAPLRAEWNRVVFRLRERSPSFGALYDRWLTGDETLEARG